jgi:hypothetical protein
MTRLIRPLLALLYAAWLAAWFWTFSFGFSSSFFAYHLGTRIPVLLLGLIAIAVPPLSCYRTVSRALNGTLSPLKAALLNLVASGAPLLLFWGVLALWVQLARLAGHSAFEADEAMGNGIVFLFCVGVFLAAAFGVPLILGLVELWRRRWPGRG